VSEEVGDLSTGYRGEVRLWKKKHYFAGWLVGEMGIVRIECREAFDTKGRDVMAGRRTL